jgi:hypothetical protein
MTFPLLTIDGAEELLARLEADRESMAATNTHLESF